MNHEFEARLRFIRLLAIVATRFQLTWAIVGVFVRSMLRSGNNVNGKPLTVFLTPNYFTHKNVKRTVALDHVVSSAKRMINDLVVIGVIKQSEQPTGKVNFMRSTIGPLHSLAEFDVEMKEDDTLTKFSVIFKVFPTAHSTLDAELYPFSIDTLSFGEFGLSVINDRIQLYDKLNQVGGIALLARMQEICQNSITQLHSFKKWTGSKANIYNSALLMRSQELYDEGFSMKGDIAEISTETNEDFCAICFEECSSYIKIVCSHSFCCACLVKHLTFTESEPKCPLCRASIEFVKS